MTPSVYRVLWVPGSDSLLGVCYCGVEHLSEDPIEAWSWLLAHPAGHEAAPLDTAPSPALAGTQQ